MLSKYISEIRALKCLSARPSTIYSAWLNVEQNIFSYNIEHSEQGRRVMVRQAHHKGLLAAHILQYVRRASPYFFVFIISSINPYSFASCAVSQKSRSVSFSILAMG